MFDVIERLKAEWTDKYVVIDSPAPELARFTRATGQVRTVNMNGRCLVEFDQYNNSGWYDIDPSCLRVVPKPQPRPAESKEKAAKPAAPVPKGNRTFLVVVDETEEMRVALRYASRRAKATGGWVALLYVIDPSEFEHFMGVREIMREEKRQDAEESIQKLADVIVEDGGQIPVVYLREGVSGVASDVGHQLG